MDANRYYNVRITIKEIQKGECSLGFKVGDSWLVDSSFVPERMCQSAFAAMYPALRTLRFGGSRPTSKDKDLVYVPCPDVRHIVIFELRRLP